MVLLRSAACRGAGATDANTACAGAGLGIIKRGGRVRRTNASIPPLNFGLTRRTDERA